MDNDSRELIRVMNEFGRMKFACPVEGINRGDWHLVAVIARLTKEPVAGDEALEPQDLKMEIAVKGRAVRVSELVRSIPVPPPAISRGLRSLEQKGLIVRSLDPDDRRNILVQLTEQGDELAEVASKKMDAFLDAVMSQMEPDEVRQMTKSLQKLIDISKNEMTKMKESCKEGSRKGGEQDEAHFSQPDTV